MPDTDDRHFLKIAQSISDASCAGRYMAVNIEHVFPNIQLSGETLERTQIEKRFTLTRVLFSNIWHHRISISTSMIKMIDTEGMQHPLTHFDDYVSDIRVIISTSRKVSYKFEGLPTELEGQSKTRGWLWFPALPQGIFPHRLIFEFYIYAPGNTSGRVRDSETLEVVFAFKFNQYLPGGQGFVTLEIEDASN
jgi:hypothetical protein